MILGYDYPLLGFFWSVLIFFIWFAWIFLLFRIIVDIFRNHQMGGLSKALWFIFIIFVPLFGVLIYVIVHGRDMAGRQQRDAQKQQEAFDSYVRQTASTTSNADELTKLAALKNDGTITEAEFAAQKAKILAG